LWAISSNVIGSGAGFGSLLVLVAFAMFSVLLRHVEHSSAAAADGAVIQ
jgi:hypothetical protein